MYLLLEGLDRWSVRMAFPALLLSSNLATLLAHSDKLYLRLRVNGLSESDFISQDNPYPYNVTI